MKIRAAVMYEQGKPTPYVVSRPLVVEDVELDGPGPGEVLVQIAAAGLCHSDLSAIAGMRPRAVPTVVGHEAAAIIRGELRALCPLLRRPPESVRIVLGGADTRHSPEWSAQASRRRHSVESLHRSFGVCRIRRCLTEFAGSYRSRHTS